MWKELSMKDKAALIQLGVDNGVYDIDEIVKSYNNYAKGGPIEKSIPISKPKLSDYLNDAKNAESFNEKYNRDSSDTDYTPISKLNKTLEIPEYSRGYYPIDYIIPSETTNVNGYSLESSTPPLHLSLITVPRL